MYVLETDDIAVGVQCPSCDGDQAVSARLEVDDPACPDDGAVFDVLHCDCGHVRLVRLP